MALLSKCYTTRMKFFHDDDTEYTVKWQKCQPGAKWFDDYHRFSSGVYADNNFDEDWPGPGEVKGTRKYNVKTTVSPYRGTCYIGTLDQFANGLSINDPPVVDIPPCCNVKLTNTGRTVELSSVWGVKVLTQTGVVRGLAGAIVGLLMEGTLHRHGVLSSVQSSTSTKTSTIVLDRQLASVLSTMAAFTGHLGRTELLTSSEVDTSDQTGTLHRSEVLSSIISSTVNYTGTLGRIASLSSIWGVEYTGTLQRAVTLQAWSEPNNMAISTTFALRPAASQPGLLWYSTDGPWTGYDTGSSWSLYCFGRPAVPPTLGAWSWSNQGGSSVDTTYGQAYFKAPASPVLSLRTFHMAKPSTPFSLAFWVSGAIANTGGGGGWGIGLREASSDKTIFFCNTSSNLGLFKYTNFNTFNSSYIFTDNMDSTYANLGLYMAIGDNGSTRYYQASVDGTHWTTLFTGSNTDFCTADQICVILDSENSATVAMTIWSIVQSPFAPL